MSSIFHLEPSKQFIDRVVLLNRFHAPDEENYEAVRKAMQEVHGNFPHSDANEQCAYLVAAIMDAGTFQEANFRTAYDYVADMLVHNNYELLANYRDQQELGNVLWDREDKQSYLAEWFKPRIQKLP